MQIMQHGQLVETESGEVIETVEAVKDGIVVGRRDTILDLVRKTGYEPIHVQEAKKRGKKPPEVSSYVAAAADSANDHLNERVYIIGAIAYQSGAFTPKDPEKTDGSGFTTFLIKLGKKRPFKYQAGSEVKQHDIPVIIKCDGVHIREIMAGLMETFGWYDWNFAEGVPGVPVVFYKVGSKNDIWMQVLPE